jgi:S-formylglutathione hydrolase FrmB
MNSYWKNALALVLVVLLFPSAYGQSARVIGKTLSEVRALQTSATPDTSRIQTVQFESKMVGATLPYNVLLPLDYNQPAAKTKRYPVLYLLHGLTGHHTNWIDHTRLSDYATTYEFIIVMPEGNNGWYTDSATVSSDKYESYIFQELIPDVEKRFRVNNHREDRAIAGVSMGGYGALKFGVKYPQKFVLAASMSGALGAAAWTEAELHGRELIRRTLKLVYGPENSETRSANDLNKLYRELPADQIAGLPFVYLDCGTEDPLLQSNRGFVDTLMMRKIPHEYRQLPGNHSWTYWDAQVQEVLRLAAKKLRQPVISTAATNLRNE